MSDCSRVSDSFWPIVDSVAKPPGGKRFVDGKEAIPKMARFFDGTAYGTSCRDVEFTLNGASGERPSFLSVPNGQWVQLALTGVPIQVSYGDPDGPSIVAVGTIQFRY